MQPLFVSAFNFHTTLHAAVTWKVSRYDVLVYMHATSELSSSAIFLLTCSQNWVDGGLMVEALANQFPALRYLFNILFRLQQTESGGGWCNLIQF